jgi:hypothetical protein
MGNRGKGEFIQLLRLREAAPKEIVAGAVNDAIRLGAIGFDAVNQIVLARIEKRPPRLNLAGPIPILRGRASGQRWRPTMPSACC